MTRYEYGGGYTQEVGVMAKTAAKGGTTRVGSGLKGFGDSEGQKGRSFRKWIGEFKCEIKDCIESPGREKGQINVRLITTLLGGPEQADGTEPDGKEVSWFLNVDENLIGDDGTAFTVDQYKSVYLAAGVRTSGDVPEPKKLAGKVIAIQGWESKPNAKGDTFQRWAAVALKDSKTFAN